MQPLDLKVPPLAILAIFALVMWSVSVFLPATSLQIPGASIMALAFVFVGCGFAVAGVMTFRRHSTTVNPMKPETAASIVTSGVYRITRNPMYLGLMLVLLGFATYLTNLVALLLVPAFVAYLTRFQIKPEEEALLARFGSVFADYMASVRRWI
jgi:protein-S-isoprenylcysteine O-methyltransferase Ste14